MKAFLYAAAAIAIAGIPLSLAAQWPPYTNAAAPKLPDGKPNLAAPAPKAADGKPDLSGIWLNGRGAQAGRGQAAAAAGAPAAAGARAAGPAAAAGAPAAARGRAAGSAAIAPPTPIFSEGPPVATFRDVGANIKDGVPMTPLAVEIVKQRRSTNQKDNPDALCLPMGFMQFHTHGQPRKMVQTPGLIVIMFEPNYGLRQIFTDGRPLPNNDPQPWWYGYSVGKWDGDTMVVETIGLRDGGWLDIWGTPFGETTKVTERFRRPTYGTLEVDVTVEDPKFYTKPWTVRLNQRLMVDGELIEFVCNENQKFDQYLRGDLRSKP